MKYTSTIVVFFMSFFMLAQTQVLDNEKTLLIRPTDSIKKQELLSHIGNGYFPTKYFNFDLRYLIKYNQYEGFRTGLGGVTNSNFSDIFKIEGYTVYGFLDEAYKYSVGFGLRLNKKRNTWLTLSYTKDLVETGSSNFITDSRMFQFFEPRLLNIELFHNTRVQKISLEHILSSKVIAKTNFSITNVDPTYSYRFIANNNTYSNYKLSMAIVSLQWNPLGNFSNSAESFKTSAQTFPKFSIQYSKSIKNLLESDFNFSKLDFRIEHTIFNRTNSRYEFILKGGVTNGNLPLSHSYHSSPNNVNKETIMQRFSVAGTHSFETMYFNEFFSDRFMFFEVKHYLKPFEISPWFKPQLVLITRSTLGDMKNKNKHQNITFNTLEKGYFESGFEVNKLLYGFGLSFAYRYGPYHLSDFQDNFAFKFTFHIDLTD